MQDLLGRFTKLMRKPKVSFEREIAQDIKKIQPFESERNNKSVK